MRKQPILLVFLFLWTVSGMRAQEEQDMVAPTVEEAAEETYIQVETTGRIAVGDTTDLSAVWPKTMQARLDALMSAPLLETSQLGLMVWDLQDDSCLYARGARWLMRPASTMKVITAVTALDRLGGDYLYKTLLRQTGTVSGRTLKGNLYCTGGFDPRFSADDMAAFVAAVKDLGVDTIAGALYADRSMKDAAELGEGWCWDDDNPTLSPLPLGRKDNFTERFLQRLQAAGITVRGGLAEGAAPAQARTVCTRTHTIDDILTRMMKQSDNLYAESMLYQTAASSGKRPATAKDAAAVTREVIAKAGLNASRYRIADGSGLSLYNYVSAELETRMLRYAFRNREIFDHLYPSLPVAGVDGTLKSRMKGTRAEGNVHAKTGTLTGIISLAGYARAANGHWLCFAIINQGVMSARPARQFQDEVCKVLCD